MLAIGEGGHLEKFAWRLYMFESRTNIRVQMRANSKQAAMCNVTEGRKVDRDIGLSAMVYRLR
jgi:hypothetical protein